MWTIILKDLWQNVENGDIYNQKGELVGMVTPYQVFWKYYR